MFGVHLEKRIEELERRVEWQDIWIQAMMGCVDQCKMREELNKQYLRACKDRWKV
jgi:uncharacterized coiled-coil protein SlyX